MTPPRSRYRRYTGIAPTSPVHPSPNQWAGSGAAPAMVARYLVSCGYRVAGSLEPQGSWLTAPVLDRRTGDARGRRWVRCRPEGGYEVRSVAP